MDVGPKSQVPLAPSSDWGDAVFALLCIGVVVILAAIIVGSPGTFADMSPSSRLKLVEICGATAAIGLLLAMAGVFLLGSRKWRLLNSLVLSVVTGLLTSFLWGVSWPFADALAVVFPTATVALLSLWTPNAKSIGDQSNQVQHLRIKLVVLNLTVAAAAAWALYTTHDESPSPALWVLTVVAVSGFVFVADVSRLLAEQRDKARAPVAADPASN